MLKLLVIFTIVAVVRDSGASITTTAPLTKKYDVSKIPARFLDAYAACKRKKHNLAVERSKTETANIRNAITKAGRENIDLGYYIGGYLEHTDDFKSSSWLWLDTGNALNYFNWYSIAPNDTWYCLFKQGSQETDYKWSGSLCNERRYFICEYTQ
ncbi:uncharacterized protein [Euwallacea similis]|uniref:uncharacterized protein n=1 Tax=Euwallacea similis TaxID=1736056 RepID=UPI00344E9F25